MPSIRRPWVTWLDGILSVLIVACIITMSWLGYRAGCYFETGWIWLSFILVIPPFALAGFLLLLPWMMLPSSIQWHQFWIRPSLFLVIGVCVSGLWNLNLFNVPGASSFVSGCQDAVRYAVTDSDIQALRRQALEKFQKGKVVEDYPNIPVESLPSSFRKCSWGDPQPVEIRKHAKGVEIVVCWGGALPGHFGLLIDPEEVPTEGIQESEEGSFGWYFKLSDGVYFYHMGG